MKSQKLKAFEDFLKRAEIIPETLLLISQNTPVCEKVISDFIKLDYEIPFYELNISDHPDMEEELRDYCETHCEEHCTQESVPSIMYFRGRDAVNCEEVSKALDLPQFIRVSKTLA